MLKAQVWPYPFFERVECSPPTANFDGNQLKVKPASKGWVVAGSSLKNYSGGKINITVEIKTPASKVSELVFEKADESKVVCGIRILCKESKFRGFITTDKKQTATIEIPIEKLRGVAEITPMFLSAADAVASNGIEVRQGAVIGAPSGLRPPSPHPMRRRTIEAEGKSVSFARPK